MQTAKSKTMDLRVVLKLSAYWLFTVAAGFAFARIKILTYLSPLPVAFIIACTSRKNMPAAFAAVGAIAGAASILDGALAFVCALSGILTVLSFALLKQKSLGVECLVSAVSYLGAFIIFYEKSIFFIAVCIGNIVLSILLSMVFARTINIKIRAAVFGEEELICASLFLMFALFALGSIEVFSVNFSNIAIMLFIMLLTYLGGIGTGTAAGALAAFLGCIVYGTSLSFLLPVVCALVAGAAARSNRFLFATIWVGTCVVFSALSGAELIATLIESVLAASAFLSVPKKARDACARFLDLSVLRRFEQEIHFARTKTSTVGRMSEVAGVFLKAGEMFTCAAQRNMLSGVSIPRVVECVAKKCCSGCVFYKKCWQTDYLETFHIISSLYADYESSGSFELPPVLERRCIDTGRFCFQTQEVFEIFSLNQRWKAKVEDSRMIAGRQLKGVARIVEGLSEELKNGITFLDEAEKEISAALRERGAGVLEVSAEDSTGGKSAYIKLSSCPGDSFCVKHILPVVNRVLKSRFEVEAPECGLSKNCLLRFHTRREFRASTGVAASACAGINGDSFGFLTLENGKYLLTLCDGMGQGENARKQSASAVSLIENFYSAGFDDETVFDSINSLMVLQSDGESFSTVDLVMIDLAGGQTRFIKIGAEQSYIISGERGSVVKAGALPIGIMEDVAPLTHERQLADGDVIVMMTDGVADVIGEDLNTIRACVCSTPQETADTLLALALQPGEQRDDMTVLVTFISRQ